VIVPLILTTLIYSVVAFLLLFIAQRFGGPQVVWAVGSLLVIFVVYSIIETKQECAAEPKYIPPSCGDSCGEGKMIFPCDGPVGAMAFGFIHLFGPLTAIVVSVLTIWFAKKTYKKQREA
jgi:hypothetical protein